VREVKAVLLLLFACIAVPNTWAQQTELMTIDQALAKARTRAPQILAAEDRVAEARGRLTGASVGLQENPTIETAVGPRFSPNGDTVDYDVTLSQSFEMGGRRGARIAGARAGIERETATSRDVCDAAVACGSGGEICAVGSLSHSCAGVRSAMGNWSLERHRT
jgi:outer membrane protein, heavy metal efflux system